MNEIEPSDWMADILSQDPMTFEDAYWGERPSVDVVLPLILTELERADDSYTRGKLIELLGETGDQSLMPVLQRELQHSDEAVRKWARLSIEVIQKGEPWQRHPKYL